MGIERPFCKILCSIGFSFWRLLSVINAVIGAKLHWKFYQTLIPLIYWDNLQVSLICDILTEYIYLIGLNNVSDYRYFYSQYFQYFQLWLILKVHVFSYNISRTNISFSCLFFRFFRNFAKKNQIWSRAKLRHMNWLNFGTERISNSSAKSFYTA